MCAACEQLSAIDRNGCWKLEGPVNSMKKANKNGVIVRDLGTIGF